eukprot:4217986-Amphidinium_carterae.1
MARTIDALLEGKPLTTPAVQFLATAAVDGVAAGAPAVCAVGSARDCPFWQHPHLPDAGILLATRCGAEGRWPVPVMLAATEHSEHWGNLSGGGLYIRTVLH